MPYIVEESQTEVTLECNDEIAINYICNYGEKLYLTVFGENAIYEMDVEGTKSKKLPVIIEEGYEGSVINTDIYGNIYVLFLKMNEDGKKEEIQLLKINSNYEVVYQKDVFEDVGESGYIYAIATDKDGYVYIRINKLNSDILFCVFDGEGNYVGNIEGGKQYSVMEAVNRCADGYVYSEFAERSEDVKYIARLYGKTLSYEIIDIGQNEIDGWGSSAIGSGYTEDFLIYASNLSYMQGFSYGRDESIKSGEVDLELFRHVNQYRCIILDDGRMLVVIAQVKISENYQIEIQPGFMMYYIPVK